MIPAAVVVAVLLIGLAVWWLAFVMPAQRQVDEAAEHYAKGRYVEAEKTLRVVLDRDSNHRDALLELARVRAATGKGKEALALYERVINGGGGTAEVLYELALLERINGLSEPAAEHFRSAWERDRGESRYLEELARTLVQLGRHKEAAELYLEIADDGSREDPERKDHYIKAGIVFLEAGAKPQARAALAEALKLAPKDPQAIMLLKRAK